MQQLRFAGLRPDSFLSYLKTLGVFRIYASQSDARARLEFRDDGAVLTTDQTNDELEAFLRDSYAPTPILNPWNKGGGLAKQSKSPTADELMRRIEQSIIARWLPYRESIAAARAALDLADKHDGLKDQDRKKLVVALYRARCPEAALAWVDTAVVIGTRDAGFPPIVGSGGNDGRLDFGVTFAQYALSMMEGKPERGVDRAALLHDSLHGTSTATLVSGSLGQYAPATAVMFNISNGVGGQGLANPWDYVFALEGAVAFAGALVKRANGADRPSYPFSFMSIAAGYGSASDGEDTRGEIWLPVWTGAATWPAVAALIRRGRLEVDVSNDRRTASRAARNGLDAVHGALTLGVASGVKRMERVVLAARNGLAFAGTSAGTIYVSERRDPALASLNRDTLQWVNRTARLEIAAQPREAIRKYEEAIYAYGATPMHDRRERARAFQEVIAALGRVDRSIALAPPKDHRPLPFLDRALLTREGPLDDGSTEHSIARAIASLGAWQGANPPMCLRYDLVSVRHGDTQLAYGCDRATLWQTNTKAMLAAIAARRTRDVASAKGDGPERFLLQATAHAKLRDFEFLLGEELDLDRIGRLVLGYALIAPAERPPKDERDSNVNRVKAPRDVAELPSAFAILKLAVDRAGVPGADAERPPLDAEIVPLLLAGSGDRALASAERRLRATGFAPRDVRDMFVSDPSLYAAALLIPGNGELHNACMRRALRILPEKF